MNMAYIITLLLLCAAYGGCIACMKHMRRVRRWNLLFMALVYVPYLALVWHMYRDTGADDWNFRNTLPTANVSPFMFSLMPLLLILPGKIKKQFHLLIAMLSVYYAAIRYRFHPHFLLDFGAHFALSAFGVYLSKSGQVAWKPKNCLISAAWIYGVALGMLVLNGIFDKAFFGLSLNGKHNIYNMVLVENSYLSALIYFVGLGAVLLLGALYCNFLNKKASCPTA